MEPQFENLPEDIRSVDRLPSLPSVAIEVLRLTRDDDADINELAQAIALDPALATKMLKLANSPSYRRGGEITTLPRACNVLGMKTVKLMALSFSLRKALPTDGNAEGFDYSLYWRSSLTTAVAARGLSRLTKSRCTDEAFLCGLLARIGQLIMAETIPNSYSLVTLPSAPSLPASEIESDVLGFNNHDVSTLVLTTWEIPRLIVDTVRIWENHDHPVEGVQAEAELLSPLVLMANSIAAVLWDYDKGEALQKCHELGLEHFGLDCDEIDRFFVSLQDEVGESAAALDVSLGECQDYSEILEDARQQLVQVSLEAMANQRETEARAEELEDEKNRLLTTANTDALTKLANRACFDATLGKVMQARLRGANETSLGMIVIDVDHFKSFNDTHGHLMGDEVLKNVANRIQSSVRATDFAARYGGEEFVVILPNTTLNELESAAERVRRHVEDGSVKYNGKTVSVTISVGGACVRTVTALDDGLRLIHLADQCLYEAKENGRNCCICRAIESVTASARI